MLIKITADQLPGEAQEAKITRIYPQVGEEIQAGESLVDMEANKQRMTLSSPAAGIVEELYVDTGQIIKKGQLLLTVQGEKMEVQTTSQTGFNYFGSMLKTEKEKTTLQTDLCIIGAGPGGYVAAIRAAQMGSRVILIEKDELGGTCLNWGCIPTKCLVRSAEVYKTLQSAADYGCSAEKINFSMPAVMARKDAVVKQLRQGIEILLHANKIQVLKGSARLLDARTVQVQGQQQERSIKADHLIIATGSRIVDPRIPGIQLKQVINSDMALQMTSLPRKMVIVGGGVIGMEFAFIYAGFGVEVSVVEYAEEILMNCDQDICREIHRIAEQKGIKIYSEARVDAILSTEGQECIVVFNQAEESKFLAADRVLMAVGRQPVTEGLGLEEIGVQLNEDRRGIQVNERMQTSIPNIYAIGDVTNQVLLAHVASAQGIVAVENIMGQERSMNYHAIPSTIFTDPEIGIVGLSEAMAVEQGYEIAVGTFPIEANGKALCQGESQGFIKIISEKRSGRILGAAIIGSHASDLIAELTLAVNKQLNTQDIIDTIHAHPTTAEIIHEAALAARGQPLHFIPR
ncbi:MAG TPA: dihydrolipoyl dehydrogenase [Syntrophomonadaceae bacterium]|nr:dihydrolipoyl dehydrogenase [Syntrophomonadaceae bacterium]